MSNIVNASEVAQVLINGSGKVDNRDFTYEDYIYPNGRPQGESVIMDSETKEAFSVVVSSRVIDTSTYLGTTKGSKEVSKILAPYTDYKINLLPMSSTAYKSVFYYNKDNLIDNLPNVLGEVPYGLADSREYYEMYKCLFDSTEGFVLYDTSDKDYVCWATFDFLHGNEELNYTNTFDDSVITASNIDVLKALLQSKYSNKIKYPVQVLQYTTDNDGNCVVNLDEVYGELISPITFASSDSLKATKSQEDVEKLRTELIEDLNKWGEETLGRPKFGNECLWADPVQGCIYNFALEYDDSLALGYERRTNKKYVKYFQNHSKHKPYLYLMNEYGDIIDIWSIPELKDTAEKKQKLQQERLNDLYSRASACSTLDGVIRAINEYKGIPRAFPGQDFIRENDSMENVVKSIIKPLLTTTEIESIEGSKELWPYIKYIENKQ